MMATADTLQRILGRLDGVTGAQPQWSARCPAHEDRRASLSVTAGEDGTILLYCHAGCAFEDITTRLNVKPADLFPTSANGHKRPRSPEMVATYDYHDEGGNLLFQVVRYSDKSFKQRRPDGKGGWIWKKGERLVVYRLPELKGCARVFIMEGEKDVDRLWQAGIPATTNPMGAGKWKKEYTEQLRAMGVKELVVIPDNDPPGEQHAQQVVKSWKS
jgi:putative DNA primase/helicase